MPRCDVAFDFDALLRATPEQRAQQYTAALDPVKGWMTRAEVRELEDLTPEPEPERTAATDAAATGTGGGERRTLPGASPSLSRR